MNFSAPFQASSLSTACPEAGPRQPSTEAPIGTKAGRVRSAGEPFNQRAPVHRGSSFGCLAKQSGSERVVIPGGRFVYEEKDTQMMFKKTIIALCSVAAVGLFSPTMASAGHEGHGGGGGGGGRAAISGGGGGGARAAMPSGGGARVATQSGGYRSGGGYRGGGGFGGAGIAAGAIGFGLGLAAAPYGYGYGYDGYGDDYGYGYGNAGYDSYAYDNGGCYLVRRRVMTPYGWRLRRVQVCD